MKSFKTHNLLLVAILFSSITINNLVAQTTNLGTSSGTGGTTNVHVGFEAGKVNTATATGSTIVGYKAGKANTTGAGNTFIGYLSGQVNTTGGSNTFTGAYSGQANTAGSGNTAYGLNTAYYNTTGNDNSFFGKWAGQANTTGNFNTFLGSAAGYKNTTGQSNTAVGYASLVENTTGGWNVSLGDYSGNKTTNGSYNCFIGAAAGTQNLTGTNNVYLGRAAGAASTTGTGNIFLGYYAGYNELGNNKLYIANSNTTTPLIYGEFDNQKIVINGKMGISTSTFPVAVGTANTAAYKLFVKGGILTEELRVRTGWADYVFNDDYKLLSLPELEQFIIKNKHLPNIPKAIDVESSGLDIGNIAKLQQEKIEELTLYLIETNKQLEKLKKEISELKKNETK